MYFQHGIGRWGRDSFLWVDVKGTFWSKTVKNIQNQPLIFHREGIVKKDFFIVDDQYVAAKKLPYGEARRLRYFIEICKSLVKTGPISTDLLIETVLEDVSDLNLSLEKHIRRTGRMKTASVVRSYLHYCEWFDLLHHDGHLVVPTSRTVFLARLDKYCGFSLTSREKIAMFLTIIEKDEVVAILSELRNRNRIRDFTQGLSDHLVESVFEWFVDLNLLYPSAGTFGFFDTSSVGSDVIEALHRKNPAREKAILRYCSRILKRDVKSNVKIPKNMILRVFNKSRKHMARSTQSQWDRKLYSAMPILLDFQIRLLFAFGYFLSIPQIIQIVKDISITYGMDFKWDPLANSGYLKLYE